MRVATPTPEVGASRRNLSCMFFSGPCRRCVPSTFAASTHACGCVAPSWGVEIKEQWTMSRKPKYLTGACPRCIARGKTWKGDNPRCAFTSGAFDGDNWNCATANALRSAAHVRAHNPDEDTAGIVTLPESDDHNAGFVVVTWYKSRGATSGAFAVLGYKPVPLTLAMAEAAIGYADEVERMKSLVAQVRP